MSAAANVFSLGSCFISGVFVPQDLMSNTVLKIASFTPNYWFVKANNSISPIEPARLISIANKMKDL